MRALAARGSHRQRASPCRPCPRGCGATAVRTRSPLSRASMRKCIVCDVCVQQDTITSNCSTAISVPGHLKAQFIAIQRRCTSQVAAYPYFAEGAQHTGKPRCIEVADISALHQICYLFSTRPEFCIQSSSYARDGEAKAKCWRLVASMCIFRNCPNVRDLDIQWQAKTEPT